MALRVGLREAERRDRLGAEGLLGGGVARTIAWYAANRESWIGRVDWLAGRGGAA